MEQRGAERGGPQRRASDPQHHQVLEHLPRTVREGLDLVDRFPGHQEVEEAELSRLPPPLGVRVHLAEAVAKRVQSRGVDAPPLPQARAEHVVEVEGDRVCHVASALGEWNRAPRRWRRHASAGKEKLRRSSASDLHTQAVVRREDAGGKVVFQRLVTDAVCEMG